MSQNEKDTLLEKFLARSLSEADKTAFEDLVRADDAFAGEVALRLAEADAFHRAREAEKADIRRRWRQRRWLRWITRTAVILLLGVGVYWTIILKQPDIIPFEIILKYPPDTFDIVVPFKAKAGETPQLPRTLCIHDTSWLESIPKINTVGQSRNMEAAFADGDYREALRFFDDFLSKHDSTLAKYPRACLIGGALNICLPEGDPEKAVLYLEIAYADGDYKETYTAVLLAYSYACTGRCEKARALVRQEKIGQLLPDLNKWLSECGGSR